jgi:hypothetical protein
MKCKGIKKDGTKCQSNCLKNSEYCYWHQNLINNNVNNNEECIVCCEKFNINDKPLPCGHWIHIDCVQKSADALQEIRHQDGYPPIYECLCPICRKPVPDLKPKIIDISDNLIMDISSNNISNIDLYLTRQEIYNIFDNWLRSTVFTPLSFFIWVKLNEKYPDYEDQDLLILASTMFENLLLPNFQSFV